MNRPKHIILHLLLVAIPLLMTMAPAMSQLTVYVGQSSDLSVIEIPGDTYVWELYNDVTAINFATDPGNCPTSEAYFVGGVNTGDSVEVIWMVPGTYFFKVTATHSCSNNIKVCRMEVLDYGTNAILLEPSPICEGDTALFTIVITGGTGPWDVTFTDGTTYWTIEDIQESPYTFQLIPSPAVPGAYQYWITSVTDSSGIPNDTPGDPVTLIVNPKPVTSPIYRY